MTSTVSKEAPEKMGLVRLNSAPHINISNYFSNYIHSPDDYMAQKTYFTGEVNETISDSSDEEQELNEVEARIDKYLLLKGIVQMSPLDFFKEKNDQRKYETLGKHIKTERSGSFSSSPNSEIKKGPESRKKSSLAEKKKESCVNLIRNSFFKRYKTEHIEDIKIEGSE
jgi:hypothetical protein